MSCFLEMEPLALYSVEDIAADMIISTEYDLAIFASGYEGRSTHIAELLNFGNIRRTCVFGFTALADAAQRLENDRVFTERVGSPIETAPADDESLVYRVLGEASQRRGEGILRVLVDYSSMSRLWYAGILNWVRFAAPEDEVIVDFAYSVGRYDLELPPLVVSDVLAVPGFEGRTSRVRDSAVFFGLGFAGEASLTILDRLEPDLVYAFLPISKKYPEYEKQARQCNAVFMEESAERVLELPLESVERVFAHLSELCGYYAATWKTTLLPMGPKPQVLASLLVSLRFGAVACLRVSSKRRRADNIVSEGGVIATRVSFSRVSEGGN